VSTLNLHVGELQRVVAQLEDVIGEAAEHPPETRMRVADALDEVAARIELCRTTVAPDDDGPRAA